MCKAQIASEQHLPWQYEVVDPIWTVLAKVKENLISNMGHDMLPLLLLGLRGYAPRLLCVAIAATKILGRCPRTWATPRG